MSIVLRPHHGMCFQFYEGKGYSEDFTDHMGRIIQKLERNPSQMIRLEVMTDVVCENCPNNNGGKCSSQDKVIGYDREVLEACGITEDQELSYEQLKALIKENIIDAGIRRKICGDCSWDYICSGKK